MKIYLNSASTSKPDKEVLKDFMWCAENVWANPSDVSEDGIEAKDIIRTSQKQIADSINAKPEEIIFTSGGSESNNWAIKGFLNKNKQYKTIISTKIEHESVYRTCQFMETKGCRVLYVNVNKFGSVYPTELEKLIVKNNIENPFVSIIFANNEIGTIQDIKKLSEVVHKYNGVLHVDAVQAYMHINIDVEDLGIDLMSASFHKFGGFKNCGFLYIRNGIELTPLIHGGHQFNSKRAGTENVPMIYAMGKQVERLKDNIDVELDKLEDLYWYMLSAIDEKLSGKHVYATHNKLINSLPNNMSLSIKGVNANRLISLLELKDIYVSAGSACNAGDITPSRVLKSIGLSNECALSTIRISFNSELTKKEIDIFADTLFECVESLKMFG